MRADNWDDKATLLDNNVASPKAIIIDTTTGSSSSSGGDGNLSDNSRIGSDGEVRPVTPLPRGRLFTLFLLTLNESFSENVMWPFMPFMIKDFGFAEEDVGVYVGILASSYFAVQFFSSFAWGKLADVVGRRPTLLGGLVGTIGAILWFGLSPNFTQALLSRSLSGLVNGNLGITKAYIAEITDSSNRVSGFAILAAAWGVGGIVAPSIGGFLSHPHDHVAFFPASWTIFIDYPYFLPCLVTAVIGTAATILGLFALPETPVFLATKARHHQRETASSAVAVYGAMDNDEQEHEESIRNGRQQSAAGITTTFVDVQPASTRAASSQLAATLEQHQSPISPAKQNEGVPGDPFENQLSPSSWSIVSYPDVMIATTSYGLTCMIWVFFDETFALFCQTPLNEGGLSMNESQIGICLAICGTVMIIFQVFINTPLNRKYGVVRIYHWCLFATGPFFLLFPSISAIEDKTSTVGMWGVMAIYMIIRGAINALIYLTIGVCVNNALPANYSGVVNGFAQSLCALGRAIGPLVGGAVWSWSIGLKDFAARNYVLYFIMMILTIGNYIWSRRLKPYLNIGFMERHQMTSEQSFLNATDDIDQQKQKQHQHHQSEPIDLDRLQSSTAPTLGH